jgi:hypothetical protein
MAPGSNVFSEWQNIEMRHLRCPESQLQAKFADLHKFLNILSNFSPLFVAYIGACSIVTIYDKEKGHKKPN